MPCRNLVSMFKRRKEIHTSWPRIGLGLESGVGGGDAGVDGYFDVDASGC